jgi:hypothetical protein
VRATADDQGAAREPRDPAARTMSGGPGCKHKPRRDHVVVVTRNGNYSAFNGYAFTPSDYSAVRCLVCGCYWRTKAAWVTLCRDATREEALAP